MASLDGSLREFNQAFSQDNVPNCYLPSNQVYGDRRKKRSSTSRQKREAEHQDSPYYIINKQVDMHQHLLKMDQKVFFILHLLNMLCS